MAWNGRSPRAGMPRTRSGGPTAALHQRQLLPPHGLPSPDVVPGFSRARFPATYEAARKALSECGRLDECKSWSDKAAALASYARQAKDETLRIMAERIHARAVRRCGELLKQVPSGQGSKNQHGELRHGARTREEAARDAGLSERQKVTALRVASVPAPKFEALVEGNSPPTVTQLGNLGREIRSGTRTAHPQSQSAPYPHFIGHPDTVRAARARKMLWNIREFCQENPPAELAGAFAGQDTELLRQFIADLRHWLDDLEAHLG